MKKKYSVRHEHATAHTNSFNSYNSVQHCCQKQQANTPAAMVVPISSGNSSSTKCQREAGSNSKLERYKITLLVIIFVEVLVVKSQMKYTNVPKIET